MKNTIYSMIYRRRSFKQFPFQRRKANITRETFNRLYSTTLNDKINILSRWNTSEKEKMNLENTTWFTACCRFAASLVALKMWGEEMKEKCTHTQRLNKYRARIRKISASHKVVNKKDVIHFPYPSRWSALGRYVCVCVCVCLVCSRTITSEAHRE